MTIARLSVDLDVRDHARVRFGGVGVHLAGFRIDAQVRLEEDAAARHGLAVFEVAGQGQVDQMDLAIGRAFDADEARTVRLKVIGAGFQLVGCDFQQGLLRLFRGHDDGVARAMRGAAGEGAHAVRPRVGVTGVDEHILHRHAQRLRTDLREDGLEALAQVRAGEADDECAGRSHVDQRLGWVAAQVHAGRVVDR